MQHTMVDILPLNLTIPTSNNKNILMNIPTPHTAKNSRSESPIPNNLQLHPATNGLRNSIRPTQSLHLHGVLCSPPREESGLERVRR